jgi:transcriptional regulator with XRE-family HTH domain
MTGQSDAAVLARNVRRIREEQHLSIEELARRTGLEKALLEAVESGAIDPAKWKLGESEAVAAGLGVTVFDLLREES